MSHFHKTTLLGQSSPDATSKILAAAAHAVPLARPYQDRAWPAFAASRGCPAALRMFRTMPAPIARIVQLRLLQARCFSSADGKRLCIKFRRPA